jgi:hypothetical protein
LKPAQSPARNTSSPASVTSTTSPDVLFGMPMPLARPPRRQAQQVHTVLREASGIAKTLAFTCPAGFVEWRRIKRAYHRVQCGNIDPLAHACLSLPDERTPPVRASGLASAPRYDLSNLLERKPLEEAKEI